MGVGSAGGLGVDRPAVPTSGTQGDVKPQEGRGGVAATQKRSLLLKKLESFFPSDANKATSCQPAVLPPSTPPPPPPPHSTDHARQWRYGLGGVDGVGRVGVPRQVQGMGGLLRACGAQNHCRVSVPLQRIVLHWQG